MAILSLLVLSMPGNCFLHNNFNRYLPRRLLRPFCLTVEVDQEVGIPGGEIELEDRFLDERRYRLAGVLLKVAGDPLYGAPQVFSIWQHIVHGNNAPFPL
jgi:hypothetical protein